MSYDAAEQCNISRFINMSHADSSHPFEQPNTQALNIVSQMVATTVICIFLRRRIYRGEEITIYIYYGDNSRDIAQCACD
jgi:SET domain-containing protein